MVPVALFVYNRPDHLLKVIKALSQNLEANSSPLFIFSDAPRTDAASAGVSEVRRMARTIQGFASIEIIEQSSNQGVAKSVIEGVTRLTSEFERVIVLEDDLLPSPHFLRYMNDALAFYANDYRVISVHAYSYPVSGVLPQTFLLRGADCWGWATWKRGWDLFESDGKKLLKEIQRRRLAHEFDFDGSYPYTSMLQDCIEGRNDSWAIRWYASAFLLDKLTLYPGSSQVQNIGADGSGFHVGATRSFEHRCWGEQISVSKIAVEESAMSRQAFANYLSGLRPSLARRAFGRLVSLLGNT